MTPQETFEVLASALGNDVVFDFHADPKKDKDPWFQVKPSAVLQLARMLKSDPRFAIDYLECLSGVDYPDKKVVAMVYHFYSYAQKHRIVVKAMLPREAPVIATLTPLWSVANWQERECYDLLGVVFEGHPGLRRILLPDDWVGHPLRKDYTEGASYHGIPTTRQNPLELFQISKPSKA